MDSAYDVAESYVHIKDLEHSPSLIKKRTKKAEVVPLELVRY